MNTRWHLMGRLQGGAIELLVEEISPPRRGVVTSVMGPLDLPTRRVLRRQVIPDLRAELLRRIEAADAPVKTYSAVEADEQPRR